MILLWQALSHWRLNRMRMVEPIKGIHVRNCHLSSVCVSSQVVTTVIATSSWSRSSRMHSHWRKSKKWKIVIVYVQLWHSTIIHSSQHFVTVGCYIIIWTAGYCLKKVYRSVTSPSSLTKLSLPTLAVLIHNKTTGQNVCSGSGTLSSNWIIFIAIFIM